MNTDFNNPTSLGVNDSLVMRYVTCPRDTVRHLIGIADSIYAQTRKYSLEDLWLRDEQRNKWLCDSFGDTIPVIVSIYDAYDKITSYSGTDEVNAAFVWHETTKMQISRFYRKGRGEVPEEDIDKMFRVIDRVLGAYEAGTESEMTNSTYRRVMVADYRLLDAYVQLMDSFPSDEVRRSVHEDYRYMLDASRKYFRWRREVSSYSDLSRELSCMFHDILLSKAASINRLMAVNASREEVMKNLSKHICLVDEDTYINFSDRIVGRYYHCE